MNKAYIAAVALALVLPLAIAGVVAAGSSPSYAINWQVLSGGGAPAGTGTISLNATLGQTVIGLSSSSAFQLSSGYWMGALRPLKRFVYLPVIFKPETLTILYVTTQNTGGVSLLRIMRPGSNALVHSCANIPDNTVGHLCGAFPPGTYQVEAQTRRCGILRAQKTWPAGPVTIRIWCE